MKILIQANEVILQGEIEGKHGELQYDVEFEDRYTERSYCPGKLNLFLETDNS